MLNNSLSISAASLRQQRWRSASGVLLTVSLFMLVLIAYIGLLGSSGEHGKGPVLVAMQVVVGIAMLGLITLIERLLPAAGPRKTFMNWLMHFQIHLFVVLMFVPAGILGAHAASTISQKLGLEPGLIDLTLIPPTGGVLLVVFATWLFLVIQDFFFYWFHRALHRSNFLWQHHKMHHMDRTVEAVSASRQNWIEALLQMLFIVIPMTVVFKLDHDVWSFGIVSVAASFLVTTLLTLGHMNVRMQVGRFSLLYCSPQVHRIHHSILPEHRDKNFAFVFPFWDLIFGTYYHPKKDEFPPTGVEGEGEIRSFWESQIFSEREWWKLLRR